MGTIRTCDKCKNGSISTNEVERYSIRKYIPQSDGGENENVSNKYQGRFQSAGSIDLCFKCWQTICEPRMRPYGDYRRNGTSFKRNKNAP
jgi:hypothetical protein